MSTHLLVRASNCFSTDFRCSRYVATVDSVKTSVSPLQSVVLDIVCCFGSSQSHPDGLIKWCLFVIQSRWFHYYFVQLKCNTFACFLFQSFFLTVLFILLKLLIFFLRSNLPKIEIVILSLTHIWAPDITNEYLSTHVCHILVIRAQISAWLSKMSLFSSVPTDKY